MLTVPSELQVQFEKYMREKVISDKTQRVYKKWLRYYLDFCQKYNFFHTRTDSLPRFLRKLQEKKQTLIQQEQAAFAIKLYYEILKAPTCNPRQPQGTYPPGNVHCKKGDKLIGDPYPP